MLDTMTRRGIARLWLFMTVGGLLAPSSVLAADPAYQVELIWGTNGSRPKDTEVQEVDPKLKEKLRTVFKWKDYYKVYAKDVELPEKSPVQLKVSSKCKLELNRIEGSTIEVTFYGKDGELVVKKKQPVSPGELVVIAGDDVNDTAWFVVMSPKRQ